MWLNFIRNKFRVRGDIVDIFPAYSMDTPIRVEFFGDEIDRISEINAVTGEVKQVLGHTAIYPASHYIVPEDKKEDALKDILSETEKEIPLDGVFISIGREPQTALFKDKLNIDENGYIIADESTRTSIDGVFAIGDVRTKFMRQIVTAAADGATAIHFAEEYLSQN